MTTIKNKVSSMYNRFLALILSFAAMCLGFKMALSNNKAEGYVDTGLKILISVVIGALLLAGLYALFGKTVLPTLTRKIEDLFNYAG